MRKNKLFLWHTHSHTFADSHCGHVACILLLPVFANLPSCILQLIKSMNRHILQWCLQVNSRPAGTSRSLSSGHIRPAGDDTRCLLRRTVRVRARSGSQPPPPQSFTTPPQAFTNLQTDFGFRTHYRARISTDRSKTHSWCLLLLNRIHQNKAVCSIICYESEGRISSTTYRISPHLIQLAGLFYSCGIKTKSWSCAASPPHNDKHDDLLGADVEAETWLKIL